jgi:hypothetical protein
MNDVRYIDVEIDCKKMVGLNRQSGIHAPEN